LIFFFREFGTGLVGQYLEPAEDGEGEMATSGVTDPSLGAEMKKPRLTKDALPGDGSVKLAPGEFFEWHKDRPINPGVRERTLT
jgi:hypothetical protein